MNPEPLAQGCGGARVLLRKEKDERQQGRRTKTYPAHQFADPSFPIPFAQVPVVGWEKNPDGGRRPDLHSGRLVRPALRPGGPGAVWGPGNAN